MLTITHYDYGIEILMKDQYSVTTTAIKRFKGTNKKCRIDENIFNKVVGEIYDSIIDISNQWKYNSSKSQFYRVNLIKNDITSSIIFDLLKSFVVQL